MVSAEDIYQHLLMYAYIVGRDMSVHTLIVPRRDRIGTMMVVAFRTNQQRFTFSKPVKNLPVEIMDLGVIHLRMLPIRRSASTRC